MMKPSLVGTQQFETFARRFSNTMSNISRITISIFSSIGSSSQVYALEILKEAAKTDRLAPAAAFLQGGQLAYSRFGCVE
jgi:hypothetical protein